MTRRRLLIAVLLIAAACGTPSEVAPTTAAAGAEAPSTTVPGTTEPAAETTTSVAASTSSMAEDHGDDEGEHEGDDHGDSGEAGEGRVVEITMTDFAFAPVAVEVTAGETVRFVVVNEGLIEHELRLSNQHRVDEHLASGHEDHGDEGHHSEGGDVLVLVPAGEGAELVVEIPEDVTVYTLLVCLLPGHYEAGMEGALVYA